MDARRRAGFRRLLEDRRLDTEGRLSAIADDVLVLAESRGDATSDDEHDPEGVTLAEEWSRLAGLREGLENELSQIDAANARLATGTYGVCAACGADIPFERLVARPFAERCVRCAT